ncbi:hypothetical protein BGZ97_008662 [Linnemannia gamsii]|uniref:Ribonucleoside-diphosphate reductase n=1 Tax=Linnemannia gamsii TaxID=64522 RepID=A0A9P6RM26_9FUNG|nr:hypothetical protein BGZ97_008662 [Linnemannia gamsii]
MRREVLAEEVTPAEMATRYAEYFPQFIKRGIEVELLDDKLLQFDLEKLGATLDASRDLQFGYLGLQTLYDRYFLHHEGQRIELPQAFFMRVAMGLALNEADREACAIEFYHVLSKFDFMSSTPTLFNSGTRRAQLSSCYLTTVDDDLEGIYEALKENALLSKFAGGLGNDWTQVRALGSHIKGTNDIEEFLELRKNTGDDRRRTHDMNTANWIPDLFMKRVNEGADWTLFSPSNCPDLHDKFGAEFETAYVGYEEKAARGEIALFKKVSAAQLWRKMLGMLEIAVCNLGSVNLVAHLSQQADGSLALDHAKLKKTIQTAMRMLDNVIDINYYAVQKARYSNLKHRPVGLGIMGFQDCLHLLRYPYASQAAVEFADRSMETVCYYAYWASTELAAERGCYSTYQGSLWQRGILPQDTLKLLADARGGYVEVDQTSSLDWDVLRSRIAQHGMRNSNCVAIAPTATISNIIGVSACIEPTFQNLYVKSNLSGEFTMVNDYLVRDLKARGLWDEVMVADLKYFDGMLTRIDRIPAELRALYATAFEIDPKWLVEAASRRQKWIDQAQSLNIYMAGVSGKRLDEIYRLAWVRGLKTTYYLRTMAATHVEKSTVAHGALNAVSALAPDSTDLNRLAQAEQESAPVCMLRPGDADFDSCEACQ